MSRSARYPAISGKLACSADRASGDDALKEARTWPETLSARTSTHPCAGSFTPTSNEVAVVRNKREGPAAVSIWRKLSPGGIAAAPPARPAAKTPAKLNGAASATSTFAPCAGMAADAAPPGAADIDPPLADPLSETLFPGIATRMEAAAFEEVVSTPGCEGLGVSPSSPIASGT